MIWLLSWFFVSLVVLIISTGVAVDLFEKLVRKNGWKSLVLASIVMGALVSLPELAVAIVSGVMGISELAVGNVLGSNIANLSLVVGGVAIVFGSIAVTGEFFFFDLWLVMSLAVLPLILMLDGSLTGFDGILLILAYLIYLVRLVNSHDHRVKRVKQKSIKLQKAALKHWHKEEWVMMKLALSVAVSMLATFVMIKTVTGLSETWNLSGYWLGLILVSLVTSLPEVLLVIFGLKKHDVSLVLGSVLGGLAINSTLIIGVGVLISSFEVVEIVSNGLSGLFFVSLMGLFWLFTMTKKRLDRWEGVVLLGIYLMFLGLQVLLI